MHKAARQLNAISEIESRGALVIFSFLDPQGNVRRYGASRVELPWKPRTWFNEIFGSELEDYVVTIYIFSDEVSHTQVREMIPHIKRLRFPTLEPPPELGKHISIHFGGRLSENDKIDDKIIKEVERRLPNTQIVLH